MRALVAVFLSLVLAAPYARADCGSIPYKPNVEIFEPNQRALIAFDGEEEILLLSTDLRASEPTKVLEVIPLPNEPTVKKGDVNVFQEATWLINRKLYPHNRMAIGAPGALGAELPAAPPGGEVTFHEQIGAHDVFVTHVLEPRLFVDWVERHLREAGVDNPKIPTALKQVVGEYLRDGFGWFVFNVVELGTETVTKEAVQYRFKTRWLYYPLRITRTEKGDTTVRLLILSPRLVRLPNLSPTRVKLLHQPVRITDNELKELDEDLYKFLKVKSRLFLRTWEIRGPLSRFQRDVITSF